MIIKWCHTSGRWWAWRYRGVPKYADEFPSRIYYIICIALHAVCTLYLTWFLYPRYALDGVWATTRNGLLLLMWWTSISAPTHPCTPINRRQLTLLQYHDNDMTLQIHKKNVLLERHFPCTVKWIKPMVYRLKANAKLCLSSPRDGAFGRRFFIK